jgi:hypothetical protein
VGDWTVFLLKGVGLMTKDFVFPEEQCTRHYCRMLKMRANYLRQQADLLDQMADEMCKTEEYCISQLEDAMEGRR